MVVSYLKMCYIVNWCFLNVWYVNKYNLNISLSNWYISTEVVNMLPLNLCGASSYVSV